MTCRPQQVIATGQVLFQRFYCKTSFVRFNVKRIAAACVWLASRVGENQRRAREVIDAFVIIECREANKPTDYLGATSKLGMQEMYPELKKDLNRCELHILRELGFVCHVELPHKLVLSYIAVLGTPPGLLQEAWNIVNDSLRSTLCVRLKPEVVACGVLYIAARRVHVPLPENPPWWEAFDADKRGIDQVCRVLARLYSLPKLHYLPVCQKDGSFTSLVSLIQPKEVPSPTMVVAPKDASLTIKPTFGKSLPKDSSTKSDYDTGRSLTSNTQFKAEDLSQRKQLKTTGDKSMLTQMEKERPLSRNPRSGRENSKRQRVSIDAEWARETQVKHGSRCQYDAGRHAKKQRHHSSLSSRQQFRAGPGGRAS
ncbi:hypothetical protein LXL04_015661 [Taraxacum kok-saghyz]